MRAGPLPAPRARGVACRRPARLPRTLRIAPRARVAAAHSAVYRAQRKATHCPQILSLGGAPRRLSPFSIRLRPPPAACFQRPGKGPVTPGFGGGHRRPGRRALLNFVLVLPATAFRALRKRRTKPMHAKPTIHCVSALDGPAHSVSWKGVSWEFPPWRAPATSCVTVLNPARAAT